MEGGHWCYMRWVSLCLLLTLTSQAPTAIELHRGRGDIMQLWLENAPHITNHAGVMRNALKPTAHNRWIHYRDRLGKFVIPYVISGKFTPAEEGIIQGAMRSIHKNSCIRFRRRRNEFDFVSIENQRGEGCYTMVGRGPGKNVVMLETNDFATCLLHETVIHELIHTIGLWHEHMRYDRDRYIKVHYENIPKAFYVQFEKVPNFQSTTYGVKYDYESVMHYGQDAFAEDSNKITMETLNKSAQEVIGTAKDASSSDYIKICSIYQCPKCMGQPFTMGQAVGNLKVIDAKVGGAIGSFRQLGSSISDLFDRLLSKFHHPGPSTPFGDKFSIPGFHLPHLFSSHLSLFSDEAKPDDDPSGYLDV